MTCRNCAECHHLPSCGFDAQGMKCYCECHQLADKAPQMAIMIARLVAEAVNGFVFDTTAREAMVLIAKRKEPS